MLKVALLAGFALAVVTATGCSGASPSDDAVAADSQNMSTAIHTTYGLTTFGGPGDYQTLACTQRSSKVDQQYYVASSQRYGCGVHLKLVTASGKCVVARTDDAGPASFVESRAGIAVMDSSPTVTKYLFGVSDGLGAVDLRQHPGRYNVTVTKTSLPLGPCDGSADDGDTGSSSSGDTGSSSSGDTGGGGSSSGSSGSGGGASCNTDGDCNPGSDGSGMICSSGECVSGCHSNAQCPGNTSCNGGQCQ
jgi:hypothetical protein